jgi:hypothetical protein
MNVYTIVLERFGTGEPSLTIVTRQANVEGRACLRRGGNGAITGPGGRGYSCASVRSFFSSAGGTGRHG